MTKRNNKKRKARPATSRPKQQKIKASFEALKPESDVAGLFRWLANAERTMQINVGIRK
jgi:hypothetical protein